MGRHLIRAVCGRVRPVRAAIMCGVPSAQHVIAGAPAMSRPATEAQGQEFDVTLWPLKRFCRYPQGRKHRQESQ